MEHIKLNFKKDPGNFTDIAEDKEGNLWIASTQGLHVFDGHTTVTYANNNKANLLSSVATSNIFSFLTDDHSGNLWVSDNVKRYFKFNTKQRAIIDSFTQQPAPDEFYFSMAYHKNTGLYYTTINYEKRIISLFNKGHSGISKMIFQIDFDRFDIDYRMVGDEHWITTDNRTIRISLDGKKNYKYNFTHDALFNSVRIFSTDSNIYFKVGSRQIIYIWNKSKNSLEEFLKLPNAEISITDAFFVDNNKVYLGSGKNLFLFDKKTGKWQNLSFEFIELLKKEIPGNLSDNLGFFVQKKDGSLFLITSRNIFRLKRKLPPVNRFLLQNNDEKKTNTPLSYRALTEDKNKNIYASYYTGISKKKILEKKFRNFPITQYINGGNPGTYSLSFWKGHLLWNNIKIELSTGKHRYLFDTTASGHCTQFLQNDSVWVYSWGSKILHCCDLSNNLLISYPLDLSINNEMNGSLAVVDMNDIVADTNNNNIWISSHFFGLCLISKQGKLIKQYTKKDIGIYDGYITDLERVDNRLWFGCEEGLGVLNLSTEKFEIYRFPFIKNGQLNNRTIFSIVPDAEGNFYIGSSKGLLYFDTKATTFFNLPDGHPLSTPEFNRAAALRATNNKFYFGSTNGLFSFTPAELEFVKSSGAISTLKLYGISVYNNKDNSYRYLSQNLSSLAKLVLMPFENNLEFSFSVTEFYSNVYYSYRLKGQSDKWTEYKPDNTLQLYALQPGNYTLEVKASTNLTDENTSYYTVLIEIKQVWYKKGWVISLFIITAVLLLFGLLRYRFNEKIKRQKDLAALRIKISSDLHDDVGTILSGLAMQSQILAISTKDETKEQLNEISNMSRDAMEHMRDTVWAMDSRKDKYENLIDRMRAFAEKNLALKNMTHKFELTNVDTKKFIDPEKRQAVYLIFKEAITNIIKHSNGKHVVIHFTDSKSNLLLSIHDNGTQKDISNSDGMGLSNMKMRAQKIGGILIAEYKNGFIVELKV